MLVVATVVFSLASVLSGFAAGFVGLLGARLLMGIAEGGIMPITQTLIASDVPHERRGLAQGLTQNFGANLLANFLGPLVIVWMGVHFGWRNAFFLAAIPGIRHGVPDRLAGARTQGRCRQGQARAGAVARMLKDRNMLLCILISTLLVAFLLVFITFTPLYLLNVRGFSQSQMSLIMSSFGIVSMAVAFLVPGFGPSGASRCLVASLLGLLLPLGILFLGSSAEWPMIACMAVGASLSGVFPLVMATIPSEVVAGAHGHGAVADHGHQ